MYKKTFNNIDDLIKEFHLIDGMTFDISGSSITDFCHCDVKKDDKQAPFNECWIESIKIGNHVIEDGLYEDITILPEITIKFKIGTERVYCNKNIEWCNNFIKEITLYYNV